MFFVSATWLPHGQLKATVEGTASLTRCQSLYLILIGPKGHREPRNGRLSTQWGLNWDPSNSPCNALTY